MRKAEMEGQLKGLAGRRPAAARPPRGRADRPGGLAVGHRIMAEAGAIPEEIRLKKALEVARAAYAEAEGEGARKQAMARIADLEMRLAIEREARRKFMGG